MPLEETAMSILGNLFVSEGKPGPVLEVKCKKRTGEDNFISCIRKALEQAYPEVSYDWKWKRIIDHMTEKTMYP